MLGSLLTNQHFHKKAYPTIFTTNPELEKSLKRPRSFEIIISISHVGKRTHQQASEIRWPRLCWDIREFKIRYVAVSVPVVDKSRYQFAMLGPHHEKVL